MDEKIKAITALDAALDEEIIKLANDFVRCRSYRCLEALATLVTVDRYADKFLEGQAAPEPTTRRGTGVIV